MKRILKFLAVVSLFLGFSVLQRHWNQPLLSLAFADSKSDDAKAAEQAAKDAAKAADDAAKEAEKAKENETKDPPTVPEPSSALLYGVGAAALLGAAFFASKKWRKA